MDMALGRTNLKTLYLVQILLERTDEDNSLNASQIGAILKSEYDIEVDRRTIYTEIGKLGDFGLDIEQKEGKLGGYYIASRQFELPELKLMVDAVQSSKFITEKKSAELIKKLENLCSKQEAKQLSNQVVIYNRTKTPNETVYYNVDKLHSAIYHNMQITFQYVAWTVEKKLELRHDGAFYVVSPLHLIWDDENYYLVAYDEAKKKLKHYRVDKMRSMNILNVHRSNEAESEQVNLADFAKKTFGMYGGADEKVRLICENNLAGVILDRFGTDIWMKPLNDNYFVAEVTVAISPQFFGWITAIGPGVRIEKPTEVKAQYKDYLNKILSVNI